MKTDEPIGVRRIAATLSVGRETGIIAASVAGALHGLAGEFYGTIGLVLVQCHRRSHDRGDGVVRIEPIRIVECLFG